MFIIHGTEINKKFVVDSSERAKGYAEASETKDDVFLTVYEVVETKTGLKLEKRKAADFD